ncbi:hypothetical protein BT93_C1884 [Corymbia citriodora subsp. variegata]|nr:hypothetical protein BT93_C1884 [Corymbia citriodora subsp. variegata]
MLLSSFTTFEHSSITLDTRITFQNLLMFQAKKMIQHERHERKITLVDKITSSVKLSMVGSNC